jgi:hypothetical protein
MTEKRKNKEIKERETDRRDERERKLLKHEITIYELKTNRLLHYFNEDLTETD